MDFDILSQIPRLLKELIAIVKEPLDNKRQRRQQFYEQEIVPIHQTMTEIHEDYSKTLLELSELFEKEGDIDKTIELLNKRRLVYITKRKDVLAFSKEIESVKKSWYLRHREVALFVTYAEAIRAYFQSASPVDMRVSWYSDFISEFQSIARRGASPYQADYSSISTGTPPVEQVKKAYHAAVHTDIPNAWQQYAQAYNKLRLDFMR